MQVYAVRQVLFGLHVVASLHLGFMTDRVLVWLA